MALELIARTPDNKNGKPALLFLHGIMHGAWCYETFWTPYFVQHGYTTYAMSLRGHGSSALAGSLRWVSLAGYVDDVLAMVARVERETGMPPVLIGHSMGGFIAQKVALKTRLSGVVFLASVPHYGAIRAVLRVARRYPLVFLRAMVTMSFLGLKELPQAQWAFFSPDTPADALARWCAQLQDESFRAFNDMVLLHLHRPRRLVFPALVLAGETDTLFTVAEEQALAAAWGADFAAATGCAHDVMLDPRWQSAADILLAWLTEKGL